LAFSFFKSATFLSLALASAGALLVTSPSPFAATSAFDLAAFAIAACFAVGSSFF